MKNKKNLVSIPEATIINKIIVIRGKNVMIDKDLAELYGVSTKRLNEQVKRNIKRFPDTELMFRLTKKEKAEVVAKCDHLKSLKYSSFLPFVFTEHGAVMLASVLNSDKAIQMNIHIVKTFNKMREVLLTHRDLLLKAERVEHRINDHDGQIETLFTYIKELIREKSKPRKKIGFKLQK